MTLSFDESLPKFVDYVSGLIGPEKIAAGRFLRDANGRLAFCAVEELPSACPIELPEQHILAAYVRSPAIVDTDEFLNGNVRNDPNYVQYFINDIWISLVDRRIVGSEWSRLVEPSEGSCPRFVFASMKGGVGRSTAIAVVAAALAEKGKNVLVLDLDLEAPGIGSLLLSDKDADDRRPDFGLLDFLTELGVGNELSVRQCIGQSGLTQGNGLVDVAPVVGKIGMEHPENFLAKLGRALTETVRDDGTVLTVTDKVRWFISQAEQTYKYDAVLLDARAGLSELTAGPVLSLDGTVYLFGTFQPQTIQDYRLLFAHLAAIPIPEGKPSPWINLKMVHAKAVGQDSRKQFQDNLLELFQEYLYEEQSGLVEFNFAPGDEDAPHSPLAILMDSVYFDWNPVEKPESLLLDHYMVTFKMLLEHVDMILEREAK